MSTVDDRVVSLRFDNAEFKKNITDTLASIDALNLKLATMGQQNNFGAVNKAAQNIDLAPIAKGVDNISSRFSVLGAVAFSTIQNMTNSLIGMATNFVRTDILAPIITGGKERAGNIEQAKFQFNGLGVSVQDAMANALDAVKGTAYGLGDAAKATGQFAASGVKLGPEMTGSLRAVAGAAAMTGSRFSDMAMIFEQSAASGKVTGMDLLQFQTRGLNAASEVAKQMGISEQQVRGMASAGTLSYSQFSAAMDKAFGQHAKDANQTYAGSLDNLHAAMSRVGASFFGTEMIQQRDLFNSLTPAIDLVNKRFQPLIQSFLWLRGTLNNQFIGSINNFVSAFKSDRLISGMAIPNIIEAMKNAFNGLEKVFSIVKNAFIDVFQPNVIITILVISEHIRDLSEKFKMGGETVKKLKSVFEGFFSIFAIGWAIIKGLAGVFTQLLSSLKPVAGGLLNLGSGVGSTLTKFKEMLVDSGMIQRFFENLGRYIMVPVKFLSELTKKIVDFFTKIGGLGTDNVSKRFESISNATSQASSVWDKFLEQFQGVFKVLDNVWSYMSSWFSQLGQKIVNVLKPVDFNAAIDIVNVGLLGGITVMLQKFFAGGVKFGFGGGLVTKVENTIKGLNTSLSLLQTNIKAQAIMRIAEAVAVMTVAVGILSLIDPAALTKALAAITVGFGELFGMMTAMQAGAKGTLSFAVTSAALIELSAAMVVFAVAVKIMSSLSLPELERGLGGIAIGLALLVGASLLISTNSAGLIRSGIAIGIISESLLILAAAVYAFSAMSWQELGQGFAAIAVGLGLIVGAMNLIPSDMPKMAAAFIGISISMLILSEAVKSFAVMSWSDLAKGLIGVTATLLAIGIAMNLMPGNMLSISAGLLLIGVALNFMAIAVKIMASIKFESLKNAIGGLAALLLILAVAVNAMNGSLMGAASLIIVSAALYILAEVLEKLGNLSIAQIVTGILAIAGVFLVLGIAGTVLSEVIPFILGLGIALALVGAGFALFGVGAMLTVGALALLAVVGPMALKAFINSINDIMKAIPMLAAGLILMIVSFTEQLLKALPLLLKLLTEVLLQIIDTVKKLVPQLISLLVTLIVSAIQGIVAIYPIIVQAGYDLLLAFLDGIKNNIGSIVDTVIGIITSFLDAVTANIPRLMDSAINLITTFINELGNHSVELVTVGTNALIKFLYGIYINISKVVDAVSFIITSFINEVGNHAIEIAKSGEHMAKKFLKAMASDAVDFAFHAGKVILKLIDGMTAAVQTYEGKIIDATARLATAVIDGLAQGIERNGPKVKESIHNLAVAVLDQFNVGWAIRSPSRKFMEIGQYAMQGLAIGISDNSSVISSASSVADNVMSAFNTTMSTIPDSLANMGDFNPVITPVLDLTRVQAASGAIASYMRVSSISPEMSTSQANTLAVAGIGIPVTNTSVQTAPTVLTFEQTINAPKELSTADIYRNTKSQIIMAKEGLGI